MVYATPPHINLLENSCFEGKFKTDVISSYPGGARNLIHIPYWWEYNNYYQNYGCYLFIENEASETAPEHRKVVYDSLMTPHSSGSVSLKFRAIQEREGNRLTEYLTYKRTPHSIPFFSVNPNLDRNPIYMHQWAASPITISFYARTTRPGAKLKLNAIMKWTHPYEALEVGSWTGEGLQYPYSDSRNGQVFTESSTDYALVADGINGLVILDVSNKLLPDLAGYVAMDAPALDVSYSWTGQDEAALVNYAYVVDGQKMRLFDVSNKNEPEEVINGSWTDPDGSPGSIVFQKEGQDYVYIADNFGLQILNVTNKEFPVFVNKLETDGEARDVEISGNYAYIADGLNGLQIINISEKNKLTLKGNCSTISNANAVAVSGIYCYVADGDQGLCIIDSSDKDNPVITGEIKEQGQTACDVKVQENNAFVTYKNFGIVIYDISNKENPSVVKILESPGAANGVDVYFNYAYVADGIGGIRLIDVSGIKSYYPAQVIEVNNSSNWQQYTRTFQSGIIWPVETLDIRIGYISHDTQVQGDAVWIDDFSVYDNLDWIQAPQQSPIIQITKDGFVKIGEDFFLPRFLWDETQGCFGEYPQGFCELVASRHFNGFYAPSYCVTWGYSTKRDFQRVLDYAYFSGLKVLAHTPVYPISGNNKYPKGEFYVKEWAEFFANHPALFGWFITDEIGSGTLNSTARSKEGQVSKWIHDAEGNNFHPTVANTSEKPFLGEFETNPDTAGWRPPYEEESDDGSVWGRLIDFFWQDTQGYYYTDIVSPNVYPIRSYVDTPENITSVVMNFTYTAQKRHHFMWTDLDGTEYFKKTALVPFIQIAPHVSCRTPQYDEVRVMSAQALANHGNGMIFWSDCRADCGTLEYQGTDYYWNLLDENSREAWGAQGMWAALPDINDGLQWMFSQLVLNRLEQENVAKKIVFLSDLTSNIDDTYIKGANCTGSNFGPAPFMFCGEPVTSSNWQEMKRSLFRFRGLDLINEIQDKDITGARLRLYYSIQLNPPVPPTTRLGIQRVLVSQLPNYDDYNLEWEEGDGDTGITWDNCSSYITQSDRRLPFENNLGSFTNPMYNESLFDYLIENIYRECLISPALIETWRDYPYKNEGFYLEPFFETGSDEYEGRFKTSENTQNRYAPHLELFYLPQGQGDDHNPFRYIAICSYDFVETFILLDNDGSNHALLAVTNTNGGEQCVIIYSPDAPISGKVEELNAQGIKKGEFDLQPAYYYLFYNGLQHVCDWGVKDLEHRCGNWALIEPTYDLAGLETRILKIPLR